MLNDVNISTVLGENIASADTADTAETTAEEE